MLCEIHLLKNHVPANLNRDETGSPKDCIFGGVPRARISSQCLKRSIRQSDIFREIINKELMGIRTRKMPQLVGDILQQRGVSEELANQSALILTTIGKNNDKPGADYRTEQILFYSQEDITAIANLMEKTINENDNDLNKFKKIKIKDIRQELTAQRPISVDIALFGRMVTDTAMRDVEAAVQVAHALSTNRLQREFDYFTAIDDLMEETNELGAGMIGDLEFNSSCFYEYFSFDMAEFIKNLSCGREDEAKEVQEIAQKALLAFLEASIFTTPSGKQNTFAAHQLPSAIYVEIKSRKIPVSYANAFAKPAEARKGIGMDMDSVEKLAAQIDLIQQKFFDGEPGKRFWFTVMDGINPKTAQVCDTLTALKGEIQSAISKE